MGRYVTPIFTRSRTGCVISLIHAMASPDGSRTATKTTHFPITHQTLFQLCPAAPDRQSGSTLRKYFLSFLLLLCQIAVRKLFSVTL
jgi:hypothetical protein